MRLQMESLKESKPAEHVRRFLYGGLVTVLAALLGKRFGPVIGGLFLAFPGTLAPSICMVEKHKIQREATQGKQGTLAARGEASVEATGASAGALGLVTFAAVLWKGLPTHSLPLTLTVAVAAWAAASGTAWWIRERL